jgi:predicted DNA-binding transcriptional regulator YafY
LLSILLFLHAGRRWTAGELARRLEVSERTIYRDMDALSIAGIPVIAERGVGGGWSLPEDYRAELPGLTETEIQSLFLAAPGRLLADLGLDRESEAAFNKFFAALPSVSRRRAEYARQRILVDATGWRHTPEDVSALTTLQDAIWQERRLHLTYVNLSNGDIFAVNDESLFPVDGPRLHPRQANSECTLRRSPTTSGAPLTISPTSFACSPTDRS